MWRAASRPLRIQVRMVLGRNFNFSATCSMVKNSSMTHSKNSRSWLRRKISRRRAARSRTRLRRRDSKTYQAQRRSLTRHRARNLAAKRNSLIMRPPTLSALGGELYLQTSFSAYPTLVKSVVPIAEPGLLYPRVGRGEQLGSIFSDPLRIRSQLAFKTEITLFTISIQEFSC